MQTTDPPLWCPWCRRHTCRVNVVERDGTVALRCFDCDLDLGHNGTERT